MELMSIRKALLTIASAMPGNWKVIEFTNPAYFRLGDGLKALIENNVPACTLAYGIVDIDYTVPLENGAIHSFVWDGSDGSYYRLYSDRVGVKTDDCRQMTSVYLGVMQEGAKVYVMYLPAEQGG